MRFGLHRQAIFSRSALGLVSRGKERKKEIPVTADKLEAAMKVMVAEVAQALLKAQQRLTTRVSETFAVLW